MAVDTDFSLVHHRGAALPIDVRPLSGGQWPTLRSMRLRALRDSPHAFVTTFATESAQQSAYWQRRLATTTWVAAWDDTDAAGIACLAPPDAHAPLAWFIESVWVDPLYRWRGVLRQMLDQLEVHARAAGATELRLWVLDTNESARRAYHKLGYSPVDDFVQDTGKPRGDGTGTVVRERLMSTPLL